MFIFNIIHINIGRLQKFVPDFQRYFIFKSDMKICRTNIFNINSFVAVDVNSHRFKFITLYYISTRTNVISLVLNRHIKQVLTKRTRNYEPQMRCLIIVSCNPFSSSSFTNQTADLLVWYTELIGMKEIFCEQERERERERKGAM